VASSLEELEESFSNLSKAHPTLGQALADEAVRLTRRFSANLPLGIEGPEELSAAPAPFPNIASLLEKAERIFFRLKAQAPTRAASQKPSSILKDSKIKGFDEARREKIIHELFSRIGS